LTLSDFGNSNEITLRAGKKRAGVVELKDWQLNGSSTTTF
jgi:hypothetical protein